MKRGFTVKEWKQLRSDATSFSQEAVTAVTPFSGLTSNALAHIRNDWLIWEDDFIKIRVPPEAPCNSFRCGASGLPKAPAILLEREKICARCRKEGETNEFENKWLGRRNEDGASNEWYETIIHQELAGPAANFFNMVFNVYGRPEIGLTPSGISEAAHSVGKKYVDKKEEPYTKLIRTGPVLYAHYGLSANDIAELTPFSPRNVRRIVYKTPGVNLNQKDSLSILKAINDKEPVTVEDLSNEIGVKKSGTHHRLRRLRQEGRVTVFNNHSGRPAATWKTTKNWAAKFSCNKCEFKTYSLCGIRTHREQVHD